MALQTWESQIFTRGDRSVRVTAMPGKHAPQPLHALLPPVMGSMRRHVPLRVVADGPDR